MTRRRSRRPSSTLSIEYSGGLGTTPPGKRLGKRSGESIDNRQDGRRHPALDRRIPVAAPGELGRSGYSLAANLAGVPRNTGWRIAALPAPVSPAGSARSASIAQTISALDNSHVARRGVLENPTSVFGGAPHQRRRLNTDPTPSSAFTRARPSTRSRRPAPRSRHGAADPANRQGSSGGPATSREPERKIPVPPNRALH